MAWASGKSPHYKKTMVFIDGSNLLIEMSKKIDVSFRADKPPSSAFNLFIGFCVSLPGPSAHTNPAVRSKVRRN
jgi:hypothetical protein